MSQQPPYPPPPTYGQEVHPSAPHETPRGRDGFAIAALVCSILAIWFFGIIFAIVALVRVRRSGKKGKVMSWISIVISLLWLAVGVVVFVWVLGQVDDVTRDDAPAAGASSSASPTADTFLPSDIREGDCLTGVGGEGEVGKITAVPCTTAHESQAIAVFALPAGAFPGDAEVASQAEKGCVDRVTDPVGQRLDSGELGLIYLSPPQAQWTLGDRSVSCLLVASDQKPLTEAIPVS